jgi:addiction module HigA family antidote
MGVTQDELATAIGVSRFSVNEIINGRRKVTATMALRLSRATKSTPDFWLNLQRAVNVAQARAKLGDQLANIRPVVDVNKLPLGPHFHESGM